MQPTASRLIRIVDRKLLDVPYRQPRKETTQPSLIDVLMKRKNNSDWPSNLRLERQLTRLIFRDVVPELRSSLKNMTKER